MKRAIVLGTLVVALGLSFAGWQDLGANIPWPSDSIGLSSVCFIGDEGWIAGSYARDSGFIFHTTDGGQTFETQHTRYAAYSVHMVTPLEGYACGWNGRVYRTTDGGANWNTLGTITTTVTCVDFPLGCDTGYCCGYTGHIARVTPDGVSLMSSHGGTVNFASVSFPAGPRRGNVCGESVIMEMQGDTWGGEYAYPSGTYNSICFVDSLVGWSFGDDGLIIHTDDNMVFAVQASPDSLNRGLFGSCVIGRNCAWAVGGGGIIERTSDGGQHWRIEAGGMTDHFLCGVFAVDTGTVYVVGNLKAFLKYDSRAGVAEGACPGAGPRRACATVLPGAPGGSVAVYDAAGRRVSAPGAGVFFVWEQGRVRKVILTGG